jgi:penicillin-binding protein 2
MTQGPRTRMRLTILGAVVLSLFSALAVRLYYLQVLAYEPYVAAAELNRIRLLPIEPARGRILDRSGQMLVSNRPSLVVSVRPDDLGNRSETLGRLAGVLGVSVEEIEKRLSDRRALPYSAIPVAEDVPESVVVYLREHKEEFPGVIDELRPVRVYPNGALAAHMVGYPGEITEEQLNLDRYPRERYRLGSIVGRSGLEYAYEPELRGQQGQLKLEVTSTGEVRQVLGSREPVPGFDLVTTIDLGIQALVEESLAQGVEKARTIFHRSTQKRYLALAGGAVVMDPRNGEVLASASFPSYDPTVFADGISQSEFDALAQHPGKPLLDRVTQAQFPPGSTFKVVTAAAALQDGVASRTGRFACPAAFRYSDTTFRNWRAADSGMITLPQALIDSCDTVFYGFGAKFWERFRQGQGERLQDVARMFGFGSKSQIEVPFEKAGRVPDEAWLKEVNARFPQSFPYSIWLPGYTINMSIGQGDLVVTPLQLANAYSSIANGGTLWRPRLGLRVVDGERVVKTIDPQELGKVDVSPANLDVIRRGLEAVATQGTARGAFAGFPFHEVSIAAKTGTAELQTVPPKQPYAWFVAYAPAKDPRYLVAVMLEEAGHGSETAAPVARRILEGLFSLPLSELSAADRVD